MGTTLLDFVMGLVRDPEAAARYAADPAAALESAGLAGVTSADVDTILPVVTDSLAMSSPDLARRADPDSSVWSSGAAAVAFAAFEPVVPAATPIPAGIVVPPVVPPEPVVADSSGQTPPSWPPTGRPADPLGPGPLATAAPDDGAADAGEWPPAVDTGPVPDFPADTWHTP